MSGSVVADGEGYSQVLKSSSIIGGAQGVNYVIGMVRTKCVAVLLGPAGVGLIGLYTSTLGLVSTFSGLGIGSSGVREVATAAASGNTYVQAKMIKVLRRVCWVTGFLGWIIMAAIAWPVSQWLEGSTERAIWFVILGGSILVGSIGSGQRALLQGLRRIGDIARVNVFSALISAVTAIALYYYLGEDGIIPAILITATINLIFSWWFAKQIDLVEVDLTWRETWENSRGLIKVGLAFMWAALVAASIALLTRFFVIRDLGIEANGMYQAAWALSGMFAGFIISAMAADYFPRLTAASEDETRFNRIVNEQIEIGILLALPGLLGTLVFAPWVMRIFYTAEFLPASELLPWFVLSVFGRVVGWPVGFVQAAKGATRWMFINQTVCFVLTIGLTFLFIKTHGLFGVALALVVYQPIGVILAYFIANNLSSYKWSPVVFRMMTFSTLLVAAGMLIQNFLLPFYALCAGVIITAVTCVLCSRGVAVRLGAGHRLVKLMCRVPGGAWLSGV